MSRTPRVTGKEMVAMLERSGFRVIRIRGSHHFLGHDDGRRTVVPVHAGETIGPGLFHKIVRDCQFREEDIATLFSG